MAAGCTPEVNEAEYHDFTSYFFAALAGRDRTGKAVPAPDYDKDGRVGMHEAFAYANIHEPSIDVPVATSDVFLRRFVSLPDDQVVSTPFPKVLSLASPAQRAALEGVSRAIGENGPDRLKAALDEVRGAMGEGHGGGPSASGDIAAARGALSDARSELIARFPRLRRAPRRAAQRGAEDRRSALAYLAGRPKTVEAVLGATAAFEAHGKKQYDRELRVARCLRLVRVAKSVLLEDELRRTGDKTLVARFDALEELERGNPLRPDAKPTVTAVTAVTARR